MAYKETDVGTRIASVDGINAKVVGTTNLFTVPTGKRLTALSAVLRLTAVVAITGTSRMGIGVAAGEDDIFASTVLTGFNNTGQTYIFNTTGLRYYPTGGDVIKLGIDTAFGGTTATLAVDLYGTIV